MWLFDWHNYIWPRPIPKVNANVMHISTVNILIAATYKTTITIAVTYNVACGLYIDIFTFVLVPLQMQIFESFYLSIHFDSE